MKKFLLIAVLGFSAFINADYPQTMDQGYYIQGGGCPGGNCPGGSCPGGNCPMNQGNPQQMYFQGGSCPGGSCPGGNCPMNQGNPQQHFQGQSCPGGNCPMNQGQPDQMYQDQGGAYDQGRGSFRNQGSRMIADRDLERTIRDNLRGGWFSQGYEQISVNVQNGIVTLRGFVLSWNDKDALEKRIRTMEGVRNLISQVAIQPDEQGKDSNQNIDTKDQKDFPQDRATSATDTQLNSRIRERISKGWLWNNYKGIVLITDNGAIIVEGDVDSPDDEKKIVDEIRKVEGVKSVNSNLNYNNK